MASNRKRLTVPIDDDRLKRIRMIAAGHGTSQGIVVRALVLYGLAALAHADTSDTVKATIDQEVEQWRAHRAEIGRTAMAVRYGKEA